MCLQTTAEQDEYMKGSDTAVWKTVSRLHILFFYMFVTK